MFYKNIYNIYLCTSIASEGSFLALWTALAGPWPRGPGRPVLGPLERVLKKGVF